MAGTSLTRINSLPEHNSHANQGFCQGLLCRSGDPALHRGGLLDSGDLWFDIADRGGGLHDQRRVERDALVIVLQYLEQMATVDFE